MMKNSLAHYEQALSIAGSCGELESILATPTTDEPLGMAIICHPHPLYQGTMHNKVVHTAAKTFHQQGYYALRFNYRGVGQSAGEYGDMLGELADLGAVIAWAQQHYPGLAINLVGFSFGAVIALRQASVMNCARLVTIAPPVGRLFDEVFSIHVPWLVIQGDSDEVVSADKVTAWVKQLSPPPEYHLLPQCSHFFHGKLGELQKLLSEFIQQS